MRMSTPYRAPWTSGRWKTAHKVLSPSVPKHTLATLSTLSHCCPAASSLGRVEKQWCGNPATSASCSLLHPFPTAPPSGAVIAASNKASASTVPKVSFQRTRAKTLVCLSVYFSLSSRQVQSMDEKMRGSTLKSQDCICSIWPQSLGLRLFDIYGLYLQIPNYCLP